MPPMMSTPNPTPPPVPESAEVARHRLRRGTSLALLALLLAALLTPALSLGQSTASASGCPAGQVQTFSRYGGSLCVDKPGATGHALTKVTIGCLVGVFAGTLPGILAGCATGGIGLIGD